jgi:hypothetical protein
LQQVWDRLAAFFALWNVDSYCGLGGLLSNFLRVILVRITVLMICLLT